MFALTVAASAGARVAPSTGESPYRASRALSSRSAPPGDYPRGAPDISRIKFPRASSAVPISANLRADIHLPSSPLRLAAPRAPAARKATGAVALPAKTARGASLVRRADNLINGNVSGSAESVAGLGGDIGARDATAAEIESGFNAKSIGEADTEHILKVPEGIRDMTELHKRSCVSLDGTEGQLEEAQKLVYQKQVADWKIRKVDGHEVLRREYRTANKEDAQEVINRLSTVAECENKKVDSYVEGPGVRIEIWSKAVNGLHVNDFILAAKIDKLDLSDKVVKKPPNVFLV